MWMDCDYGNCIQSCPIQGYHRTVVARFLADASYGWLRMNPLQLRQRRWPGKGFLDGFGMGHHRWMRWWCCCWCCCWWWWWWWWMTMMTTMMMMMMMMMTMIWLMMMMESDTVYRNMMAIWYKFWLGEQACAWSWSKGSNLSDLRHQQLLLQAVLVRTNCQDHLCCLILLFTVFHLCLNCF